MQGGQITWKIDADKSAFDRQLNAASSSAKDLGGTLAKTGKTASNQFAKDMGGAFSSISTGLGTLIKGIAVAGVAGSIGFGAMAKAAYEQVRQVENATFALNAYEKNGAKVNTVLKELVSFARSDMGVLFQREDLFQAAQTLKLYGQSTDSLVEKVKILSRGVALGKTTFAELSAIVGRAAAKGRLDAVDFDMLIERGIGLDKSFRGAEVTSKQLFKALEKALPAQILADRANSIDGVMIRLKSAFRDLGGAILGVDKETSKFVKGGLGDRFLNIIKDLRITLRDPAITRSFQEFGKQMASLAETAIPLLIKGVTFLARNVHTILPLIASLVTMFVVAKVAAIGFAIAFSPLSLTAFLLAGAITALIGAFTFLQLRFNIVGRAIDGVKNAFNLAKSVVEKLGEALGNLAKGAMTWIKDRVDDFKGAIENAQGFLEDHKEIIKQITGVLTVLFGPALVKVAAIGVATAAKHVASAALTAAAWTKAAVATSISWTVAMLKNLVITITVSAILIARAVASGFAWTIAAIKAGVVWTAQMILIGLKATAGALLISAQASIAGYAWLINAIRMAPAWIWGFLKMSYAAIAHTIVSVAQASKASFAWILAHAKMIPSAVKAFAVMSGRAISTGLLYMATASKAALRWAVTHAAMAAGAIKTAAVMVAAGIKMGIGMLFALGPIGLVIGAIAAVAAGAYLVIRNWEKVKSFFGRLGGFILGAVGNFGSLLYNSGKALISGLISGVKSMAGAAGNAVKGVVNEMKSWLPGSPAEKGPFSGRGWTPYRGRALVEGFAQGISSGGSSAVNAMRSISTGVAGAIDGGSPSLSPSMAGMSSSGGGSSSSYNIGTINIASEVDGERWLKKLTRDQEIIDNGLTPSRAL